MGTEEIGSGASDGTGEATVAARERETLEFTGEFTGWSGGGLIEVSDLPDQAVTAVRKSFDKLRLLRGVAESGSNFVYGSAQAVIEIDKGIRGTQFFTDFVAGEDFAGARQQQRKQLERLRLQTKSYGLPE
jgi:hypothetical protein